MLLITLTLKWLTYTATLQNPWTATHYAERISSSELAAWATAMGTVLLAVVAALQDKIRMWVMRPKLELLVRVAPPECHKTTWVYATPIGPERAPCYYFRLGVTNKGNTEAREVEVFAACLSRRAEGGTFQTVGSFTPMNLMWSHFREPFLRVLSPRITKMCDLAHTVHANHRRNVGHVLEGLNAASVVLAFDLQVEPNMKGHLVGPGVYRLRLIVAASNARPKEREIAINLPGQWYDDEAQMLRDGFRMGLV